MYKFKFIKINYNPLKEVFIFAVKIDNLIYVF